MANTFDNESNLEQSFLDSLYVLEKEKPKLYNRMVLNSDDEDDVSDQIIPESDIRAAIGRKPWYMVEIKKIIAMDVARYGDDKTVLYALRNNMWEDQEVYELKNTMETSGYAMRFMKKFEINDIVVDSCGLGAGVVDRLREQSVNVIECNSASQASDPTRWRNLRAEMWEHAADLFREGKVSLPNDPELINELTIVRYKTIESNGRLQVESKEEIKKRLGKSPDKADAFVMGLWAIDKVESAEVQDAWAQEKKRFNYQWNSETC
jgi:phage terminase large subunit